MTPCLPMYTGRVVKGSVAMLVLPPGPGVDVVLLLDSQWYGLWPLGQACRAGKPVFCDPPLTRDDQHADSLWQLLEPHPVPALMALRPALAPAVQRLHTLVSGWLGPA